MGTPLLKPSKLIETRNSIPTGAQFLRLPNLQCSKSEAIRLIGEQIRRGRQIRPVQMGYEVSERRFQEWDIETHGLTLQLLGTDTYAKEYQTIAEGIQIDPADKDWGEKFNQRLDVKIALLKEFQRRIDKHLFEPAELQDEQLKLNAEMYDVSHLHAAEQSRVQQGNFNSYELSKLMRGENPWAEGTQTFSDTVDETSQSTRRFVKFTADTEDSARLYKRPSAAAAKRIEIRDMGDPNKCELFMDGFHVDASVMNIGSIKKNEPSYLVYGQTRDATDKLLTLPCSELQEIYIAQVESPYSLDWHEAVGEIWVSPAESGEAALYLGFSRISKWRRPYSFEDYLEALGVSLQERNAGGITLQPSEPSGRYTESAAVRFSIRSNYPMTIELQRFASIFRDVHESVEADLDARFAPETFEVSFDFPQEVRVACEQYLLYFVQFLKDLGVEVTADLHHEAGSVLFSVTPTDKETALDNIRTALETYLQLSGSPVGDSSLVEIEGQRLAATVEHLRSQIRLQIAELQLKDATIQTQQVTINRLWNNDIMVESMKDVTPRKEEDKEAFLGGTVALTRHNYKGLELNYPEMFRMLRRLFKKKNNNLP